MGLVYQLDAMEPSSLWEDDAKTIAATNGGVVAAWSPNASSAVTTDAIQTSNTRRPLYRSDYSGSGYPAIEFDGVNSELQCAHSVLFSASVYDFFMVLTPISLGVSEKFIFGKITNVNWNDGFTISHQGNSLCAGAPAYNEILLGAAIAAGTKILIAVRLCVGDRSIVSYRNDASLYGKYTASGGAVSSASTSALCFGGSTPGGGFYANFALHEVRIYTGGESLTDRSVIAHALADKWGSASPTDFGLPGTASSPAKPSHPMYQQVIG